MIQRDINVGLTEEVAQKNLGHCLTLHVHPLQIIVSTKNFRVKGTTNKVS